MRRTVVLGHDAAAGLEGDPEPVLLDVLDRRRAVAEVCTHAPLTSPREDNATVQAPGVSSVHIVGQPPGWTPS